MSNGYGYDVWVWWYNQYLNSDIQLQTFQIIKFFKMYSKENIPNVLTRDDNSNSKKADRSHSLLFHTKQNKQNILAHESLNVRSWINIRKYDFMIIYMSL